MRFASSHERAGWSCPIPFVSVLGVVALSATGCAPEARVRWEIELGPTADRMAHVIVERRAGDCAGPALEQRVLSRAEAVAGTMSEASVQTGPGPQGFAAIVLDAACERIGSGCVDLTLGQGVAQIRVVVREETASHCGEDCPVTACRVSDAGMLDAPRSDAAGRDASPGDDASSDAALDAWLSPVECRARASDDAECAACGGLWCDAICCPGGFVCCDATCRRIDCTGMAFEP